jgi:thiol-disulfide isomerase/thioredoxin
VKLAATILAFATASAALGVTIGETYEQVVAEKGRPVGVMNGGTVQIVTYPDMVLKVKDGLVSSIKGPEKAHFVFGTNPPPSPPAPAAAPRPAAPPPRPEPAATRAPSPVLASDAVAPEYRGPPVWEPDMGTAMHEAQETKRHILVLFTGSDWCEWCQKMDDEVFSQREFAVYTHANYIIVKLDYPRQTPQSESTKRENAEMLRRFDVRGFPNAVIMDENSRVLTRIEGYREGGVTNFIAIMKQYE